MQLVTHQFFSFTAVLWITGRTDASLAAALGSVLPDSLEFVLYGQNVPRHKHRRWTHWFPLYLFPLALVLLLKPDFSLPEIPEISFLLPPYTLIVWFLAGALFHIAQDAICGKVPLLKPNRKTFGVRLFRVGSATEKTVLILTLLALSGWCFRYILN